MQGNIDWANLGFSYMPTKSHIRYVWKDGQWNTGELISDPHITMHIAATALHYGQSAFEGLKAFRGKDGQIRVFRPHENAQRLARSAQRLCMTEFPEDLFIDAIKRVVRDNQNFVPPYGTGGSLYIRPLLFGSGARIGVNPADEYTFIVMVLPVGPYYKGGLKPVRAIVLDSYDRAAPLGVGHVKAAGNYAASLRPHIEAAQKGFPIELYLDAKEHCYIDEFSTSNFIGISQDGTTYVTPKSTSILPSITNASLQQIARDMGMQVECRPIHFDEVKTFSEVGACGTAVVVTPVNEIVKDDTSIRIGPEDGCGPVLQQFYERVTAIQYGESTDEHAWTMVVEQT